MVPARPRPATRLEERHRRAQADSWARLGAAAGRGSPAEEILSGERVERRLAAILAADVAGYSRLMGADEEGTLERLKALRRELLDPKIAEHHGPHRQDHRRRPAGGICQRRRCGALRGRGAAGDARAEHRRRGGQPHRIAHRHQSRRRDRRGRRPLWRRRQHRRTDRSPGRCRRGVRLQYGP